MTLAAWNFIDEKFALFNFQDREDTVEALQYAKENITEHVENTDLLKTAEERAKTVITGLINSMWKEEKNSRKSVLKHLGFPKQKKLLQNTKTALQVLLGAVKRTYSRRLFALWLLFRMTALLLPAFFTQVLLLLNPQNKYTFLLPFSQ